jgi:hypothetical protein
MVELVKQLEEERSRSASMKSHFNILQQQLSDAQNSAQVYFQN